MLGWQRIVGSDRALVLINVCPAAGSAALSGLRAACEWPVCGLPAQARLISAFSATSTDGVAAAAGQALFALPAKTVTVFTNRSRRFK